MKCLFFDLEMASCYGSKSKICEFGFVVVDENFEVLERGNYIINPNINKKDWDWYALKNILTRKREFYEKEKDFTFFYYKILKLINSVDYVFGHSIGGDAKALNDECKRYHFPSIDFTFYDVKDFFKDYSGAKEDISVTNILKSLQVEGDSNEHDAEADAYNTMLAFKAICEKQSRTMLEEVKMCSRGKGMNKNYIVEYPKH